MTILTDNGTPETLRRNQRRVRRAADTVLLTAISIVVLGCLIGWIITGDRDWVLGGAFYGGLLFCSFLHVHFVILRIRPDPVETQRRWEQKDRFAKEQVRRSARWTGLLMVVVSPIFLLVGLTCAADWTALLAGLGASAIFLVSGLLSMRWGRRR